MHYMILVSLLTAAVLTSAEEHYSFSPLVGSSGGASFSLKGEGRITAVKIWDSYYVYGLQFRYGDVWSDTAGSASGTEQLFELYDDEAIIQVSGKFNYYMQWIMFVTSRGRSVSAGYAYGNTFNMYPEHQGAELRFLSGSGSGPLMGISAHWAVTENSQEQS